MNPTNPFSNTSATPLQVLPSQQKISAITEQNTRVPSAPSSYTTSFTAAQCYSVYTALSYIQSTLVVPQDVALFSPQQIAALNATITLFSGFYTANGGSFNLTQSQLQNCLITNEAIARSHSYRSAVDSRRSSEHCKFPIEADLQLSCY